MAATSWDVGRNRLHTTLDFEADRFTVGSIAYSPDGQTLALAGSTYDPTRKTLDAQVWLFGVDQDPPRRRAVLTFDPDKDRIANGAVKLAW